MRKLKSFLILALLCLSWQLAEAIHVGGAHEHLSTLFTFDDYMSALKKLSDKYPQKMQICAGVGRGTQEEGDQKRAMEVRYKFLEHFMSITSAQLLGGIDGIKLFTSSSKISRKRFSEKEDQDNLMKYWIYEKEPSLSKLLHSSWLRAEIPLEKRLGRLTKFITKILLSPEGLQRELGIESRVVAYNYAGGAALALAEGYSKFLKSSNCGLSEEQLWKPLVKTLFQKAYFMRIKELVITVPYNLRELRSFMWLF